MAKIEKSEDIVLFAYELIKYMQNLPTKEVNQEDVKFALVTLADALLTVDKYIQG